MKSSRYWLIHPNGGRQLIDPRWFDLEQVAEQARRVGGHLVVEGEEPPGIAVLVGAPADAKSEPESPAPCRFEPPLSALASLFRSRLEQIYLCECDFTTEISSRQTSRMLGSYYKRRRLVRIYACDRALGRRPLEDLFDTFLHEVAHHIEYTEPHSYNATECGRVPGRMHSPLFWQILGDLKHRWNELQRHGAVTAIVTSVREI